MTLNNIRQLCLVEIHTKDLFLDFYTDIKRVGHKDTYLNMIRLPLVHLSLN